MRKPQFDYLKCQSQILVDMHVPDWDPGFLADFDPVRMADLYQRSGAQAVMHYCNSHMGLCYWPCSVSEMNKLLEGRDFVSETVTELHQRGIASCAYYSCMFNNWAWTHYPDWRIVVAGEAQLPVPRMQLRGAVPAMESAVSIASHITSSCVNKSTS